MILLNNDLEVEIPNYELQHPLSGIAANGTRISNQNITEVNIYHEPAPLQAAVLGKVFLSGNYQTVSPTTPQTEQSPSSSSSSLCESHAAGLC